MPTGRYKMVNDTSAAYQSGNWGENFSGRNIPPPLPTDVNGKIIYSKVNPKINPVIHRAFGGGLDNLGKVPARVPILQNGVPTGKFEMKYIQRPGDIATNDTSGLYASQLPITQPITTVPTYANNPTLDRGLTALPNGSYVVNDEISQKNKVVIKANGGKLNAVAIPNKNSIQINPKAELITNDEGGLQGSHETGDNIPVVNAKGQLTARVEPKEVVMTTMKGDKVALSNRLGFAQLYQNLDMELKTLNGQLLKTTDNATRNTIKRNADKVRYKMEMLPSRQEQMKTKLGINDNIDKGWGDNLSGMLNTTKGILNQQYTDRTQLTPDMQIPLNIPNMKLGKRTMPTFNMPEASSLGESGYLDGIMGKVGGIGNIAQVALPFVTNWMNNRTLNKSMNMINESKVTPLKYRNLDDKVDNSAQIDEVNRSYREGVGATRNLSDARSAASMKASLAASRVAAINPIQETASNTSRGVRNQNVSGINQVDSINANKADELSRYKLEARVGLNNAKIAGRNQSVDNIYQVLKEGNLKEADKISLELILKTYNQNGVMTRQMSDQLKKYGIDIAATK